MNPKNTKKLRIHENTNAKIICDFGDERFRIAAAGLEKDIFVRTHLHTARLVVRVILHLYETCFSSVTVLSFKKINLFILTEGVVVPQRSGHNHTRSS